jgi:hypothetical protein
MLRAAMVGTAVMAISLYGAIQMKVPMVPASLASGILYVLLCGWLTRARIRSEMQGSE